MARNYIPAPQHAIQRIEQMIVQGEIKPGEPLPSQRDLAQSLGLSRASLREAISILETLGLVKAEPGRGVFVCEPKPANGAGGWRFGQQFSEEEVYQARIAIEPEIAALAAQRLDVSQLRELRAAVDRMRQAIGERDIATISHHDSAFHELLCEASGNRVLIQTYRNLTEVLEESQRRPMVNLGRIDETVREHQAILEALDRRDPKTAYRSMRRHILGAASRIGIRVMTFFP